MEQKRKFFQENLRKNVEIKQHIASYFYKDIVKRLSQEIEDFARNTAKELDENEK